MLALAAEMVQPQTRTGIDDWAAAPIGVVRCMGQILADLLDTQSVFERSVRLCGTCLIESAH
jgi:hypothetical protein